MESSIENWISVKFTNMAFLCATMVVVIHCQRCAGSPLFQLVIKYLPSGLCKIAVPFFFLASGFFIAGHVGEKGWYKNEVLKRVRTLLLPFVVWEILWVLWRDVVIVGARNLITGKSVLDGVVIMEGNCDILRFFGIHPAFEPELSPLWFVRILFLLVLTLPVVFHCARLYLIVILWTIDLLFHITSLSSFWVIPGLRVLVFAGCYFCSGIFLRKKNWTSLSDGSDKVAWLCFNNWGRIDVAIPTGDLCAHNSLLERISLYTSFYFWHLVGDAGCGNAEIVCVSVIPDLCSS